MLPLRQLFARDHIQHNQPSLITELHLQNDLVVVHPPQLPREASTLDGAVVVPNDTLLSGFLEISSESNVLIWNIRIALVVTCKFRRSEAEPWQQGIIYEQSRVFNHLDREAQISTSADRRQIHRHIDFALMVPSSIATHEYLPNGIIVPQIRVSVEFSENTWSAKSLAELPILPPVYVDEGDGTTTVAGRQMRTESYSGGSVKVPPPDPVDSVITHGSSSSGVPDHPVQTWIKNFAIIADPNAHAGTNRLRLHKRGFSAGVGEWDLYWWSDVFSVGGYVMPRLELKHMDPDITIFGIHACILQTYTIIPTETFRTTPDSTERLTYPTETFALLKDGHTPAVKCPTPDPAALFGSQARQRINKADGIHFTWEPGRVRLLDDHHLRPSRFPGTTTPFDIQHTLQLRVFFSVRGESMSGEKLKGKDQTGEMRMLVINLAEQLSSCCCSKEWVSLPSYEECVCADSNVPYCACCYNISDFPGVSFDEAFSSPEGVSNIKQQQKTPAIPRDR